MSIDLKLISFHVMDIELLSHVLPRIESDMFSSNFVCPPSYYIPEANFSMASVRIGERLQYEPRV